MTRPASLLLALVSLTACDTGPTRQQILASLVGHPASDALRTFGAPNRVIEANGHKFLGYDDASLQYVPGPFIGGFAGFGYGYVGSAHLIVRGCETTIEVVGDRVASYTLRGNSC